MPVDMFKGYAELPPLANRLMVRGAGSYWPADLSAELKIPARLARLDHCDPEVGCPCDPGGLLIEVA